MHKLEIPGIDLDKTFNCGQAFRWRQSDGGFLGAAGDKPLFIRQEGDFALLDCPDGDLPFWEDYFALDCDYVAIWAQFADDEKLRLCREHSFGIRVLRQPPFETLITFIVSANNHVPRIRSIVERLCEHYGKPVGGGNSIFSFPTPESLSRADASDILALGAGYRAPYIVKAAKTIADGFDLDGLRARPEPEARKALVGLPGVGPKVAQCVMLFGLGFSEAFPVDVWMKRVLEWLYPGVPEKEAAAACVERFGANSGVAQQLLFHYARQVRLFK